jgi:DNA-binding beta-propeller fold protein YncE
MVKRRWSLRWAAIALLSVALGALLCGSVLAQDEGSIEVKMLLELARPWDAVPSPDASTIYFTAVGQEGSPGVFSIPFDGGDVTEIAGADTLVMPLGIATSSDGQTLYVSDPWAKGSLGNAVYALSLDGVGEKVAGTQWTMPQGVEIVSRNGADVLYFTGIDPTDGQPAVYSVPASGGKLYMLAKGAPLSAPSGIAIAQDGTVYVLDKLASGSGLGSVLRISESGQVDEIAGDIRTGGQMAGLTLTQDESLLLASSLGAAEDAAQVVVVDLTTMQTSVFNDVIRERTSAGGLHRAHDVDAYAWAEGAVFGLRRCCGT